MKRLKLKTYTQLINGMQTLCYCIFDGDRPLVIFGFHEYDEAKRIVDEANKTLEK